jgi:arylsulfatase A-like enzyme
MLLRRVEDLGLLKDTLVLFTTDHGFLHGEHGIIGKSLISDESFSYIPLYEEINHIPFILHYPGADPGRSGAIVQPLDVMPTFLELAGAADPGTMHGASFAHLLQGGSDVHRSFAVSTPYLRSETCPITVATDRWAAVLHPKRGLQAGLIDRAVDGFEKIQDSAGEGLDDLLFDLAVDPGQSTSVAGDHPDVIAKLRGMLVGRVVECGADDQIVSRWR